ncbi:MAG: hypothetical protein HY815_29190 [Candidatus Riflebacteria bacterium]|nr:hypothetical protein [Candidatus Riflebacteria bacterium]
MTSPPVKPLVWGLIASLSAVSFFLWVWPLFVPPSPLPFLEEIVANVRTQNYEAVYDRLSDRWRREKTRREYVAENLRDDQAFIQFGGFVESVFIEADQASYGQGEVYVPVYYKMKTIKSKPPRTYVRKVIVKLLFHRGEWRLDGLKVFQE